MKKKILEYWQWNARAIKLLGVLAILWAITGALAILVGGVAAIKPLSIGSIYMACMLIICISTADKEPSLIEKIGIGLMIVAAVFTILYIAGGTAAVKAVSIIFAFIFLMVAIAYVSGEITKY